MWLDLSTIGSDSRFESRVARNAQVTSWLAGTHRLHLFFDSLDEGLLRVDYLTGLLREWLSELGPHRHRLSLRLACRTGEWPGESLESFLQTLWPENRCDIYDVAPLQRTDVVTAAEAEGMDPYAFIGEVLRVDAVSLAIRPLTLRLLLNTFKRGNGRLPEARRDVYLEGIAELCTERGQGRRESGRTGHYTERQRMAVAARVAYIMTFAGLSAIRTVPPLGDLQDGEIAQADLVGGNETEGDVRAEGFPVTDEALAETLGTGLFTSRGPDRLGWAHRDYRDFLAAWYVSCSAIGADQCMALLQHPDDPRGVIAPQLRTAAAWLAEMNAGVFRRVLACDYASLLDADAAPLAPQDRAAFATALLSVPDKAQLVRRAYVAGSLPNLSHPGLAAQLHAALADADPDTGRLAIAIARDSGEGTNLRAEVADIALDRGRPLVLRASAAYAIAKCDDAAAHTRLRTLALEPDPTDVQDELKGNALRACWPAHLSVAELFGALTRPRDSHLFGAYLGFLSTDILRHVPDTDLPVALDWMASEAGDYFLDRIADGILWRTLPHLERAGMARAFALAFIARIHHRHQLMRERREEDRFAVALREAVAGRRQVVEALLPILHQWGDEPGQLMYLRPVLVFADDLPWVIERIRRAEAVTQPLWIALLGGLSRFLGVDGWSALYEACEAVPAIDAAFREAFAPVDIDSPHADELRTEYARDEALRARLDAMQQEPPPPPALAARLAPLLDRSEASDSGAWIAVCRELGRDPDGRLPPGYLFTIGLTSRPGWAELEDAMQRRIVVAAERYVALWTPAPERWLARSPLRGNDIADDWAGLQAIVLIHDVEPAGILNCAGETWRGWAPVLAGFPYLTDAYPADAVRLLIAEAHRHAPDAVIDTFGVRIRHEAEQSGYITVLSLLADCWDDSLTARVLDIAASRELSPEATGQILDVLLDHGAAVPFLESLVDVPLPTHTRERHFAVVAATLMIRRVPGSWPRVWAAISADAAFGRELVEEMVRSDHWTAGSVGGLVPDALADLYLWLIAQYPPREDPVDDDDGELFHEITVREDIATWRDSIPGLIMERATPDALAALRRVSEALPHIRWLRIVVAETEDTVRRATWRPRYTPTQLLRLAHDSRSRIVQNGDHLLAIIEESLQRLERDILHGATPQMALLWNDLGDGTWRPKDELTLSDYVKVHLERELPEVVVNREVEIHLGNDRLDILVDALPIPPANERIAAVVEVKGGWNRDWRTAMRTQLSDRYLVNGPYRSGLYLVGWYMCDQWNPNDQPRFRDHPKEGDIAAMRSRLEEQAAALSTGGRRVHAMVLDLALGHYTIRRRRSSST
ncbi:MAG: NACHT domain-containing protein [Thermomicrobiales bacterium]